jgi:transposase
LTDIRWGKNKENLPLPQTMEIVVYSVSSHMPVYYRTFPGNMPDSRSIDVILADLEHAGFSNLILITDRGYETIQNLEKCISKGQSVVMCAKTSQKDVTDEIIRLGDFGVRPNGMKVDAEAKIYYAQFELSRKIDGFTEETPKQLKLNLYFDSVRRSIELMEMDICISLQDAALADMRKSKSILKNDAILKREFCYYDITFYAKSRRIKSYALNESKVEKARRLSGFFSIITHGVDYDAMKTYVTYGLRDEQEKYFQQMKDQMCADRQRNWSEEGKTGRLFILFVSLILSSYVRHIWRTTKLYDIFSSTLEVLDEMRSIRFVEHENETPHITSFVGAQVEVCSQFGFTIPAGCKPTYRANISRKGKRGRPSHKVGD